MTTRDKKLSREVIGLLPAGGRGARVAPLPCSKELYPIGFWLADQGPGLRPKVVCHYLLEKIRLAGISKAYVVLRKGKWDIPTYLGDGAMFDMHLGYLIVQGAFNVPCTLDQAYPFVGNALVAFGFPDILFEPDDAFVQLLNRQRTTTADMVLGLFPVHQPETMDMVDVDDSGRIRSIVIKPSHSQLRYGWIIAVWTPIFTSFMHDYLINVQKQESRTASQEGRELSVGHVIQAAVRDGFRAQAVFFSDHTYLDIGTPDGLVQAVHRTR